MMIKRLFRQHTTVVLTIPKPVLNALDLKAGDYVEIEVEKREKQITIAKVYGRINHGRNNEDDKGITDRGWKT